MTTPKDGTTKKRKRVKATPAQICNREANEAARAIVLAVETATGRELHLTTCMSIVNIAGYLWTHGYSYATTQTGIIKKARK